MSELGDNDGLFSFDDDDEGHTLVQDAFWTHSEVPDYPALAHFGRFEILGRIARGGMAEVYLAREREEGGTSRHLVLKRVLPEMEDHPDLLRMFLAEGQVARRLFHNHVCHVYESGEIDGIAFMALEWVWGPSLHGLIRRSASRGQTLPWPVAVEVTARIAAALHYIHNARGVDGRELRIVHRDVSPHNIMLGWTGTVKLLDFGIAKTNREGDEATAGKYGYLAPEQARSGVIDARCDIFALGIVLFEALTGQPLYERDTVLESLHAVVHEPVPRLLSHRPELPPALDSIVQRALAKEPTARFQSAGEFQAALSGVLRAEQHSVTDQRIALTVAPLFDKVEKAPLREERRTTAAFKTLTAEGAARLEKQESVTFMTFEHEASVSGASSLPPAEPQPEETASKSWLWASLGVVSALAVMAAGVAAWWLLR